MSVVWKYLRDTGRMNCSYDMFRIYVQRHIRQAADKNDKGKAADSSSTAETSAVEETAEVKTAKNDDSADSEKAELEPWEKKFKIAEEKIAAMKKKHPNFRIDPKPIPENDKALAKKRFFPLPSLTAKSKRKRQRQK